MGQRFFRYARIVGNLKSAKGTRAPLSLGVFHIWYIRICKFKKVGVKFENIEKPQETRDNSRNHYRPNGGFSIAESAKNRFLPCGGAPLGVRWQLYILNRTLDEKRTFLSRGRHRRAATMD